MWSWLSSLFFTSFEIKTRIQLPSLPPRTPADVAATAARQADPRWLWHNARDDRPLPPATAHTLEAALALLRDHAAMIALNPLVLAYELLREPDHVALGLGPPAPRERPGERVPQLDVYRVTDALPVAFAGRTWWTAETTYVARFEDGSCHTVSHTRAAWGVSNAVVWRLWTARRADGDEVAELTESATVWTPFFLHPFVKATVKKAHRELGQAFVERLRHLEEMKVKRMEREEKEADEEHGTVEQQEMTEGMPAEATTEKKGESS